MKPIILLYILVNFFPFLFWNQAQAQLLSAQTRARIDSIFSHWNTSQTPGAVVGIIYQGNWVHKQAYGMADIQREEKLATTHSFWVASVAKQFTAMSIALLAEKGKLSLEDDVRKYLPELPYLEDTIRIKHLVYHTSGLRDGFTLLGLRFKGEKRYTNANVLKALSLQQKLNFKPGERHEYNNGGYVLLAHIVERVSGEPLADFTSKHIFQPLGMKQTYFYGKIDRGIPHLALGYDVRYKGANIHYRKGHFKGNTVGSSGLVTSLDDLYKWDQNFYHNKLGKASPELIELVTTPGKLINGQATSYAFGLEVEPYKGQLAITHSGADEGYKAEIVRFPALELTIIGLANTDDMYSLTHKLFTIGQLIAPAKFQDTIPHVSAETLNPAETEHRTGYYINPDNLADLRVLTQKEGTFYAARSISGYQEPLKQLAELKFVNQGTGEYSYLFTTSEDGHHGQLCYQERANSYILQKMSAISLPTAELKRYTGIYYSPELNKRYHLSVRKGRLGLRIFHFMHIPFQALAGDLFLADLMGNNSLLFTKNDKGEITGFEFSREAVHTLQFFKK
jgi:CubicO group peptidase (beta-lactamase class C family)